MAKRSAAFDSSVREPDRRPPAGAVIVKAETKTKQNQHEREERTMRRKTSLYLSVAAIGVAVLLSTPTA